MNHKKYMRMALEQAEIGSKNGNVPIGAVIVKSGKVIAKAHNLREEMDITTGHAEIIAIERANKALKSWRLDGCSLYVTIEPCPMCAGAIIQSRIDNVYYGAMDSKAGVHKSVTNLFALPFNHEVKVKGEILEKECSEKVSNFFKKIREQA